MSKMTRAQRKAKKQAARAKRQRNELARQKRAAERKAANLAEERKVLVEQCKVVTEELRKFSERPGNEQVGRDCLELAMAGGAIFLDKFDVTAEIVCGYATWQLGDKDHENVTHDPRKLGIMAMLGAGFAGHAWLKVGNFYFDPTAWSLPLKLKQMDDEDGQVSNVTHNFGDFQLFQPHESMTEAQFSNKAPEAGDFYFEADKDLSWKMVTKFMVRLFEDKELGERFQQFPAVRKQMEQSKEAIEQMVEAGVLEVA